MRKITQLFLVTGLLLAGCSAAGQENTTFSQKAKVSSITLTDSVETSGNLSAAQLTTLTWGTSGLVEQMNVKLGDHVKKGDRLAQLKSDSVPADMLVALSDLASAQRDLADLKNSEEVFAQAQLSVITARKDVEEATNNLEALDYPRASDTLIKNTEAKILEAEKTLTLATRRYKEVRKHPDGDPVKTQALLAMTEAQLALNELKATLNWYLAKPTEEDYDEAKAKLEIARAAWNEAKDSRERVKNGNDPLVIASAKAKVAAAQAKVNAMYIIAPFDGEVISIHNNLNDTVENGGAAIGLINRDTMKIDTLIDETSISSIQIGNRAEITMETLPGVTLTGKVSLVDPIGQTISGLVKYTVVVSIDPTEESVLFGATATVKIITSEPHSALAVPIAAVQTDSKSEYVLRVGADSQTERVDIQTGDLAGNLVTITTQGTLKEGDEVLIGVNNSDNQNQNGPGGGAFGPGG